MPLVNFGNLFCLLKIIIYFIELIVTYLTLKMSMRLSKLKGSPTLR